MTITALLLTAALTLTDPRDLALEQRYWDCDTAFMLRQLEGDLLYECLGVREEFRGRIFHYDQDLFMEYWLEQREQQWQRRGYSEKRS